MGVKVIEVDASRLDEVYSLVSAFDNPRPSEHWKAALSTPWCPPGRPHGLAATIDGRMVGFLGTFFVERCIDGKAQQICNFHTLILDEEHRGAGLRLILRGFQVKEALFTALTPVRNVHRMLCRGGFVPLDDKLRLLAPVITRGRNAKDPQWSDVTIADGADAVLDRVDDTEARLVLDHAGTDSKFLMLERGDRRCLVSHITLGHRLDHSYVLHVGDPELFAELSVPLRHHIMEQTGTRLLATDSRFLRGHRPPSSAEFPIPARRLVRPAQVEPWKIDNLYSEMSVLGAPAIPSVREELRQHLGPILHRYIPGFGT